MIQQPARAPPAKSAKEWFATSLLSDTLAQLGHFIGTLWLFSESDFPTFVVPNTAFGILGALLGSQLTTQTEVHVGKILGRLPLVVLFNWSNVLVFELANQRQPESVKEDLANKPWRPLPTGRMSSEGTRRLMLVMVFVVLATNFGFGVWRETALLFILTWLYNDLKGGDELIRDLIIAIAFGLYNHGSLTLAMESDAAINRKGYTWIAVISGVILTTMQVQDLKDQPGDRMRGRRTLPIVFGDMFSRWMIAVCVALWSFYCVCFWDFRQPLVYTTLMTVGGLVSFRALRRQNPREDARTWKIWCGWTASLYALPLISATLGARYDSLEL
ncbi:MAG: hypothetical protein Q9207_002283 [Kuettlingeria erythrocarpa]